MLLVSIKDTGMGIEPEKQEKIFEMFSQADSSTTREFGGTGLGLSISSQLVSMMGGRMWVESRGAGKGSTFYFTLEFKAVEDKTAKPPAISDLSAFRFLAVDDNTTNRRILEELLGNWGLDITVTESGPKALNELEKAAFKKKPFHILISDYNMPEMNGLDLCERIRENPVFAGILLIILSSAGGNECSVALNRGLIDALLLKPVRQSQLLNAIQRVMGTMAYGPDREDGPKAVKGNENHPQRLDILLAEDSEINQAVATGLLEAAGHRVTVARNGLEAINSLNEKRFDLVLMDIQMPEMDGLAATREIRKQEARAAGQKACDKRAGDENGGTGPPRVPIIALTAHTMTGDRKKCLEVGMDGYVSKPLRPDELFTAIKAILSEKPDEDKNTPPLPGEYGRNDIFDLDAALLPVDGNLKLLKQIISIFLETGPGLVADIRAAIDSGDPAALRETAHRLKGTLDNFGAHRARTAAFNLEKIGEAGDLSAGSKALVEIEAEVKRFMDAILSFNEGGER